MTMTKKVPVDDVYQTAEEEARDFALSRSLAEQEVLRRAGDPHRLHLDAILRARGWAEEFDATGELDGDHLEGKLPAELNFAAE